MGAGGGCAVQGNRSTACPGPRSSRAEDHESQVAVPRDTQQHDAFLALVYNSPTREMLFQSVRRSGPDLGPSHFTHSCFTHLACAGPKQSLTLSRHPRKRGRWEKGSYLKPRWRASSAHQESAVTRRGLWETLPQGPGQVPSSSSQEFRLAKVALRHCLTILLCLPFPVSPFLNFSLESFSFPNFWLFLPVPFLSFPCFHYMECPVTSEVVCSQLAGPSYSPRAIRT